MMRSVVAVIAGLVVTVGLVIVLSILSASLLRLPAGSAPTPLYLVLNLLSAIFSGMVGGSVAVRLAPDRLQGHVFVLALVILLMSLPTLLSAPAPGQPSWYGLVISIIGPTSVVLGGFLAIRGKRATRPF